MKRKYALLLAIALLSMQFISCSGQETSITSTTISTGTSDTVKQTEARIYPKLPEEDYGGYEFRVLTKGKDNVHWNSMDICAEEETGDPINDAVYLRNTAIEEKYNIKVKEIGSTDTAGLARKSILAQNDEYDMLCMSLTALSPLITAGQLLNLNDMPNMDLSMPWYDQNANEDLSLLNKLYVTVGDLTIMDNDATWAVLFNKKIAKDLNLGNLYEMVENGTWTIDKMYDLAKLAAKDLNGDGKMDENDQWGIESQEYNTNIMCLGSGARFISKDADDAPYISMNTEQFINTFLKAMPMQTDYQTCLYATNYTKKYTDVWTELMDKTFSDGHSLFNFAGLNRVTLFRSMETDFGILPVPKYDEAQKDYHCAVVLSCANSIAVPITATDTSRTGLIIEALSAESLYTLTPAYYDITLSTKFMRDEESVAMLDLIFSSRVYDLGEMFDWGGIFSMVLQLTDAQSLDITSGIEKRMKGAEAAIQKTMDSLSQIE